VKYINHLLFIASIVCLFLVLKSSEDPVVISSYAWLFEQFNFGNAMIFNCTSGLLVSIWFYFLVVYLPDLNRKHRIKNHFIAQYNEFRRALIIHILACCREPYSINLTNTLTDITKFREYFKVEVLPDQERWHVFLNNLDDYELHSILLEFEAFKDSISYLLSNIDIQNQDVFAFLHRIRTIYTTQKNVNINDDSLKSLSRLLWEMLAGFSRVDGYRDYDYFIKMFNKI
jgi:hypothetical protein